MQRSPIRLFGRVASQSNDHSYGIGYDVNGVRGLREEIVDEDIRGE